MKHYPVQILTNIQDKDNHIICDFIKKINYKIKGDGYTFDDGNHFIAYAFSYKNAIKFMKLLDDLGYLFKIKLHVKTLAGIPIYE